jgi:hypothetical protein
VEVDDTIDARHEVLALAILGAFVERCAGVPLKARPLLRRRRQ